jgi:hypothetical protein
VAPRADSRPDGGADIFSRSLVERARLDGAALTLDLRLNWYRALPLSCVEQLAVTLDGTEVDLGNAALELAGRRHSVRELAAADGTWWHVADAAVLTVPLESAPADGPHDVTLTIGTRIPYLVDPAGSAVVIVDRTSAAVSR